MLVGNLVAILASALVCVVVSLIKPDHYDWKSTREISMVDDAETGAPRDALARLAPALVPPRLHWQAAVQTCWGVCLSQGCSTAVTSTAVGSTEVQAHVRFSRTGQC